MENDAIQQSQESKQWMSPKIIIAAVILLLIILLTAYFMNQKSSNLPDSAAPTPQPSEAVIQESVAPTTSATQESTVKQFTIDGSNFKFTPNAINVNEGDTV
ncbi:MAG: hypothetical protein Q7T54_06195, partial [Candidatus Levybacteria bacterium]|nr:hypothetical protein [Candidatus Levybacteria bacterium]